MAEPDRAGSKSRRHHGELLIRHVEALSALQKVFFAAARYALLLIFQAVDAAERAASSGT